MRSETRRTSSYIKSALKVLDEQQKNKSERLIDSQGEPVSVCINPSATGCLVGLQMRLLYIVYKGKKDKKKQTFTADEPRRYTLSSQKASDNLITIQMDSGQSNVIITRQQLVLSIGRTDA